MGSIQELDNFVEAHKNDQEVTPEVMNGFLAKLRAVYRAFLDGQVTDVQVSDATVNWSSTEDQFSDKLKELEPRIGLLNEAMDITHPDFSKNKKRKIIGRMLGLVEELMG